MAADFRFVAHAAERHAHELAARGLGDRLAERGLADAGRADEAEDRSRQLVGAALHGEIFEDALLDLVEAEVIGVEHVLRLSEIPLDLGALAPRDRQDPVEIVAHDGGFGRHRRHLAQLLELGDGLVARFLGELGVLDALLELGEIVLAVLVAQLLLDRLHLLVEIIFALRLLHLALDARANALLDLQDRDFALHQRQAFFEAARDADRLQHVLLVGDLHREMRRDRVGELRVVVDLRHRADDLGRDALVELHIALEFGDRPSGRALRPRPASRVRRRALRRPPRNNRPSACSVRTLARATAFDEHLHRAVGQLQQAAAPRRACRSNRSRRSRDRRRWRSSASRAE